MPIHKQIHIRLTSSFDKWLQMASIQGELLSLQSEKKYFKFSHLYLFVFLIINFHTKKWISVDFRVDCVAGLGACVSLHCKHMVFLADTLLSRSAFLWPTPYPNCCHYQSDITRRNKDTELHLKIDANVCHDMSLLLLQHIKYREASGMQNTSEIVRGI